jgi:hypothetical protein
VLRRSSSAKFSRNVTWLNGLAALSPAIAATTRLPSRVTSKNPTLKD